MDDFRLRVFITAAKTLNFTKCAEQLFISQPAVSQAYRRTRIPL